jgi:hypothetical protein
MSSSLCVNYERDKLNTCGYFQFHLREDKYLPKSGILRVSVLLLLDTDSVELLLKLPATKRCLSINKNDQDRINLPGNMRI